MAGPGKGKSFNTNIARYQAANASSGKPHKATFAGPFKPVPKAQPQQTMNGGKFAASSSVSGGRMKMKAGAQLGGAK